MTASEPFFGALAKALSPLEARYPVPDGLRPAGVLVPLRAPTGGQAHAPFAADRTGAAGRADAAEPDGAGIAVVLARRTERVPHHKGQICFPGGSRDPGDRDLLATALREAREEIGIREADVELLGTMEPVPTVTGFFIQPYVARLRGEIPFRLDPFEVAEVFEAPLALFAEEERYRCAEADFLGRPYRVWFIDCGPHTVWGATAMILRRLAAIARGIPAGIDTVPPGHLR